MIVVKVVEGLNLILTIMLRVTFYTNYSIANSMIISHLSKVVKNKNPMNEEK